MKFAEYRERMVDPTANMRTRIGQVAAAITLKLIDMTGDSAAYQSFPVVDAVERPWHEEVIKTQAQVDLLLAANPEVTQ